MPFNFTEAGATGISANPEKLFLIVGGLIAIGVIIGVGFALYNLFK